jgi:uridine phosphorylase
MRYVTPQAVMEGRFEEHPGPRWDVAVLCFRASYGSTALLEKLGATPLKYKVLWGGDALRDCPYVYEARLGGRRVGVVAQCQWGGPQAAILVEELAHLGVSHFIGFGAAGSLLPDLAKGTQIVASTGLVTDGTSRAYTSDSEVAVDTGLHAEAQAVAASLGVDLVAVRIATVDAVYRETEAAVQSWLDAGAQAINMETTPLYAASVACGAKSLWLGHISDCLVDKQWDTWKRSGSMTETSVAITMGVLERLVRYGQGC